MKALVALFLGLSIAAANAQLLLGVSTGAGGGGGGGGCPLFNPSMLASAQYQVALDGSTVAWSGSNFGTTANPGSLGSNIVAGVGTVVKGTQLNGLDTLNFNANTSTGATGSSLTIAGKNWSGNIFVFGVFASNGTPGGTDENAILTYAWGSTTNPNNATTGWAIYPRDGYQSGRLDAYASGSTTETMAVSGAVADTSQHIHSIQMGSANSYRKDGTAGTLLINSTVSPASVTNMPFIWGKDGDTNNFGAWTIAYMLIGNPPYLADVQKLEGWAAWRFGLTANLPSGHPYKSVAPPCNPVISNPGTQTIAASTPTVIPSVSVAASKSGFSTITVSFSNTHGLLSASGPATITGSGTVASLTIAGSLANVNASLATLSDNNATGGSDPIVVSAIDNVGNSASPQTIPVTVTGGSYSGPGDVVTGASLFYGLRAYNSTIAAAATAKLIKVRNTSTSETCDVIVATSGGFGNVANCSGSSNGDTVAVFCALSGGSCTVATWYDQIATYNVTQATTANQPSLMLSGCLGTSPCIVYNGST